MTYRERIDGCPDMTPDQWRRLNGPMPRDIEVSQKIARYRAELAAVNGMLSREHIAVLLDRPRRGRPLRPVESDRGERFLSARSAAEAMGFCRGSSAVVISMSRDGTCAGRRWRYLTREELSHARDARISA